MHVNEKSKELAAAIMASREFEVLKQAKSNLDKNRELKNKIEDFKKKEKALFNGNLSPTEAEQRAAELNKILKGLSSIPEIDRFLKAENDFNSMLQRVYNTIGDTLESYLKFQ